MMKLTTILLSIHLLLLALIPCGDRLECNVLDSEVTSIAQTPHNAHEHETEICSPFCICACCGQLVHVTQNAVFQIKTGIPETQLRTAHKEKQVAEPFYAIWQPPKLI